MKQISTLAGILVILVAAVILFGGVFAWQYFGMQNASIKTRSNSKSFFGFELNNNYPNGAEIIVKNKEDDSLVQKIMISQGTAVFVNTTLNDVLRYDQDTSFDGYNDLQVLTGTGSGGAFYDFYVYNPAIGKFEKDPVLYDLADAVFTDYGTITTHNHYVCGGNYSRYNFNFNQSKYVLTQSKDFDCCNNNTNRKVTIKKLADDGKWETRNETCPVDSYSIDPY